MLFSVGLIPENELSIGCGIELSTKTKGAIVYENRETSVDGIFACGNVLQVHDLVDFVSEEAEIAGLSASLYVKNGKTEKDVITTACGDNVSYTLPQKIDKNTNSNVKLFFRVNKVIKNCLISVECDGKTLIEKKKKICVPGEMETALLLADKLKGLSKEITVSVRGDL